MPNTYTELRRTVLGTATGTVTFDLTGISGYTDLVLVANVTGIGNISAGAISVRFNSDTATNYSATYLMGNGSTATSGRASNDTRMIVASPTLNLGNNPFVNIIQIQNYSNTTTNKTVLSRSSIAATQVAAVLGLYRSTSAITSITYESYNSQTMSVGSTFSLYGIAAAPAWAAKATGGTITNDVQYTYHTFTSSGTFTPLQGLSVDYLVLAGGGSGAAWGSFNSGGGGGAGGLQCNVTATGGGGSLPSRLAVTAQAYTVTVGAGGSASNGSNSTFSTVTSTGGGYGGRDVASGATGGSGGGGSTESGYTAAGAGTANQGYAGGTGVVLGDPGAGGGGGAGAVGGGGSTSSGGNGGAGIATLISGSSVTYGGGGGGGRYPSAPGTGGTGGGGNGSANGAAVAGTANRGGGGGGAGGPSGTRGAGGSGIVIIRYEN